jgi:hypothetical protein
MAILKSAARANRRASGILAAAPATQNELKGKSMTVMVLYLNGCDLRKLPLIERKTLLKKLIAGVRYVGERLVGGGNL